MPAVQIGVMDHPGQRWARGGIGGPDRPVGDGCHHGVHDGVDLGQAADAGLARGEGPGRRGDDPVAEVVGEAGDVRSGRRMGPHVAVHRWCHDDRRRGGETGGGHDVAGQPGGHRAKPVCGGRGDDDHVGRVGHDDVPDPTVRQEIQDIRLDRMPG